MRITKLVPEAVADLRSSADTHGNDPCFLITDHMGDYPVLDITAEGVFLRYGYSGNISHTLGRLGTVRVRNLAEVMSDQATIDDIPERLKSEIIQEYRANTPYTHPDAVPNAEFICALAAVGVGAVPMVKAIRSATGLGLREAKNLYDEAAHVDSVLVRSLVEQGHCFAQVLTQLKAAEKSALERSDRFDWGVDLGSAFGWTDTPQGWSFWHEVDQGKRIL